MSDEVKATMNDGSPHKPYEASVINKVPLLDVHVSINFMGLTKSVRALESQPTPKRLPRSGMKMKSFMMMPG
jgi:hypothetical protein